MSEGHVYQFASFRLDGQQHRLFADGQVVPLTPKAVDTLLALVRRHGQLVTKDELMQEVWPGTFVSDSGLARNISVLRKALGTDADDQRFIETIPKRGYRFVAPVVVAAPTPETEVPVAVAAPTPAGNPRRRLWVAAAVVITVAAGVVGFQLMPAPQATLRAQSVAVLPFLPAPPAGGDVELIGMGMADALVARLGAAGAIELRPSRATLEFTSPDRDARDIGRALRVEAVVDGLVSRDGPLLRVTARVIRVADGTALWSDELSAPVSEQYALHDRIAAAVAAGLGVPAPPNAARARGPRTPEAYDAYLAGRHHWNKRTRDSLLRAVAAFSEAIDHDPAYASAYAGLADSYALLGVYGGVKPEDAFERARAAATRAIAMDDTLADAHASLGFTRFAYDWDWRGAEQAYARAIALNPNYATAHQWQAILLMVLGRADESIAAIRRAQKLDPLSPSVASDVAELLLLARQPDAAIRHAQEMATLLPGDTRVQRSIGSAYLDLGLGPQAIAHFDGRTAKDDVTSVGRVRAHALAGDRLRAEQLLAELDARAAKEARSIDGVQHALACLAVGRIDAAFADLERAFQQRSVTLTWLKVLPALDPVRRDPRFAGLERRLRLDGAL